jgi:hypothetical protein
MTTYKDFLGINICIYDPILGDSGAIGGNSFGYSPNTALKYNDNAGVGNVSKLTEHASPQTLVLLNLHRNGPYGYPTWKQIRTSQNPLSRAYRLSNTFTYVQEPGPNIGTNQAKYGNIISLKEPVIAQNLPISLIGEVAVYNESLGVFEKKPVEIKTAFNNETEFFANSKANEYFNTILQTDENYETLKDMYLDGGLDDEGSLLDSFSLLTYRQTIWPKVEHSFLNQTRSRTFYVNTFWRNNREDREKNDVVTEFGFTAPSQSMWPLDAAKDFATRTKPVLDGSPGVFHRIGGDARQDTAGGEGILQNSYSHVFGAFYQLTDNLSPITGTAGFWSNPDEVLSASVSYTFRHTIKSTFSNYNPSFPTFNTASDGTELRYQGQLEGADFSLLTLDGSASMMLTSSLFEGVANWDAPAQAGKAPFYDSYEDYAQEIKRAGKGYSIIPEFRISSHVDTYVSKGVTEELKEIFELSGGLSQNTTTESDNTFYKVLSNSDFLKHFDLIKKDHEGFADEKILTLKCKAIKKFLPYEGFYPAQRTVQLGEQFVRSYKNHVVSRSGSNAATVDIGSFKFQPLMTPLFAPGILFNTIKSGVGVDFPIFTGDSQPFVVSSSNNNYNHEWQYPSIAPAGPHQNYYWAGSGFSFDTNSIETAYNKRIPFEALVEPEEYLANLRLITQEPHPFGMPFTSSGKTISTDQFLDYHTEWDGRGDDLYKKMAHNMLAEIPELFLENTSLSTISSLEEGDPTFGNAVSGNYYTMRVKMKRSRVNKNQPLGGFNGHLVDTPQDIVTYQDRGGADLLGNANAIKARFSTKESLTMYSRPSAFGPATFGGNGWGTYRGIEFRECGSWWGTNYPYTAPYYHGEAWCDLIFYADKTKKYTLDEILTTAEEYPYYTRHWWNGTMDALRDLSGYSGSTNNSTGGNPFLNNSPWEDGKYKNYTNSLWEELISGSNKEVTAWPTGTITDSGIVNALSDFVAGNWGTHSASLDQGLVNNPDQLRYRARPNNANGTAYSLEDQLIQHPFYINYNAMQLDSSVNLFGKGTVRKIFDQNTQQVAEVASADTIRGKTRWIIQPKFETPILNFKKYENMTTNDGTMPLYASESVPRGMWHQYGDVPEDASIGVFLQVADVPNSWLEGALGMRKRQTKNMKSLADLVGFSKDQVRLGEVASKREVSEAVVAVPFVEQGATRKFFSIPRADINSSIEASRREIDGNFPAGGPPKAGDTVYQMVKNMQKYVFPPSMDFVKYKEVDPFAMYIFEFKHTFSKQDLADMWQNLPPEIGRTFEEAEASISHELLSAELLGDGAVVKSGVLDENAEGKGVPSNIQWMVFKVKKRAKTNYFDKIIAKKGTTDETSDVELVGVTNAVTGKKDKDITYNWPYDFFSLVELVKIDAEISFANIENDDKGQKSIKKVESKKARKPSSINKARGKG